MKKRLEYLVFPFVLIVLTLILPAVFAVEVDDDIELDNIHILTLKNASEQLVMKVEEIKKLLEENEALEAKQLDDLRIALNQLQGLVSNQFTILQNAMTELKSDIAEVKRTKIPEVERPATFAEIPPKLFTLLAINIFLLILVIILIFWLRNQYYKHKIEMEEHIHPAPEELVAYVKHALLHKMPLHELRIDLANRGWSPSIIEHAIRAAKEKKK